MSHDRFVDELRRYERMMRGHFPAPTPGQLVYERWCGSNRSDHARYWRDMNPAEKRAWESTGEELRARLSEEDWERFVHNIKEYGGDGSPPCRRGR